jgi:hypothetical protein
MQNRYKRDHGGNADGDDEKTKPDARTPALPDEWLLRVFPGFLIDPACFVAHSALRSNKLTSPSRGAMALFLRRLGW